MMKDVKTFRKKLKNVGLGTIFLSDSPKHTKSTSQSNGTFC